jgi:membrane protease YdiL (CAAX protease family)
MLENMPHIDPIVKERLLMQESKNKYFVWITLLAALTVQVLTWFVLYPLAGYNDITLLTAQAVFLALGIGLILVFDLNWKQIGVGVKELIQALIGISISYGLLLLIILLLNATGYSTPVFRHEYQLFAFANNWLLTGFGEELVFAGILFNLLRRSFKDRRRWIALLLTAGMFSLWHLPGYVAIGLRMDSLGPGLIFDLLLHIVSWGFFGMIYLLSGNLWLTAFAHASTDYALLPGIINSPFLGLVFMFITLALARWMGKRQNPAQQNRAISTGWS